MFLAYLEKLICTVSVEMGKAQKRHKRPFHKLTRKGKTFRNQDDWALAPVRTPTGSQLVVQSKGPYHFLRTNGGRFTIESDMESIP